MPDYYSLNFAKTSIPIGVDEKLYRIAEAYMRFIEDAFVTYLDAWAGINKLRESADIHHNEILNYLKINEPHNATCEYIDLHAPGVQHMLEGEIGNVDERMIEIPFPKFRERTDPGGRDFFYLSSMLISLLYSGWEDHYREKLAVAKGLKKKNDLISQLFGDIGALRHAVVHAGGLATSDVEKCFVINWFKKGDQVFLSPERAIVLIRKIDDEIAQICNILPRH